MKLSTASRYGLRALIDLLASHDGKPVSLHAIADRQQVSVGYLEHMFSVLRKAGLVISVKGSLGGYLPAESLGRLTAGEILRVLEGDLSVIDSSPRLGDRDPIRACLHEKVWDVVNRKVAKTVDGITMAELAVRMRERMRGRAQGVQASP